MNTDNMKPYLRLFRTFISVTAIVFLVSSCASVQLNQKNWAEKTIKKLEKYIASINLNFFD